MMMRHLLVAALVVTVTLAGCLDVDPDARAGSMTDAWDPATAGAEGTMTARETREGEEGFVPEVPGPVGVYHIRETITVEGTMDLERIPVHLVTRNGDVHVSTTRDTTAWRLVVQLSASGPSPAHATEAFESMRLEWSHERDGRHHVDARVHFDDLSSGDQPVQVTSTDRRADVTLEVPADVLMTLRADTRNGEVHVTDAHATTVVAESRNGDVTVKGGDARAVVATTRNEDVGVEDVRVADVHAKTRNGNVRVDVVTVASGTIDAESRNGNVDVRVLESATRGYSVHAETRNGKADIRLTDGTVTVDEDGREARFRTADYASRDIRTVIRAETRNEDAVVRGR